MSSFIKDLKSSSMWLLGLLGVLAGFATVLAVVDDLWAPYGYWALAILAGVSGLVTAYRLGRLRGLRVGRSGPVAGGEDVEVFTFSSSLEQEQFLKRLGQTIAGAEREIYRSGRGFSRFVGDEARRFDELLASVRKALDRRVKIVRLQTSFHVAPRWAGAYADLMERYSNFHMYGDQIDSSLVNVGVIDPIGDHPIVQLLFEGRYIDEVEDHFKPVFALFIYNRPDLAKSVREEFVRNIKRLKAQRLSAEEVRNLDHPERYFAYGSNLSTDQMLRRCPGARLIGKAVLYGWDLEFSVYAEHYGGRTAGIRPAPDKSVHGVVYGLTREDKAALDAAEQGGYVAERVTVKVRGQDHPEVFTYVPDTRRPAPPEPSRPSREYLETMLAGAREHGLSDLERRLETLLDDLRDDH